MERGTSNSQFWSVCSPAYRFLAFLRRNPTHERTTHVHLHDFLMARILEPIQASLYEMIVAVSVHRLAGFPDLEFGGLHLWGILAPAAYAGAR